MKTYPKLPAIIGILGASALVTNLATAIPRPVAEKPQADQSYDDIRRGTETRDVKSRRK